jgi:hypothetical protein
MARDITQSHWAAMLDILSWFCPFFFVLANTDRAKIASITRISQKRSTGESWTLGHSSLGAPDHPVDFDWTKAAVEKVQNAIADAERDA